MSVVAHNHMQALKSTAWCQMYKRLSRVCIASEEQYTHASCKHEQHDVSTPVRFCEIRMKRAVLHLCLECLIPLTLCHLELRGQMIGSLGMLFALSTQLEKSCSFLPVQVTHLQG